jgi:hypothetical protein
MSMGWIVLDEILKVVTPLLAWLGVIAGITLFLWYLDPRTGSISRVRGENGIEDVEGVRAPRQSFISWISVPLISLATGWVGFAGYIAEAGPGETMVQRSFLIIGVQVLGAIVIATLLPKRWYLSFLAAWGSLLIIFIMPTPWFVFDPTPVQFPEDIICPNWVALAAVLFVIASGYIASRVRITHNVFGAERQWSWLIKAILAIAITVTGYTWFQASHINHVRIIKSNTHKAQALWREINLRLPTEASENEVMTFLCHDHPNFVKYQAKGETEYRIPVGEEPASKGWGSWTAGVRLMTKDGRLIYTGIGRWTSNQNMGDDRLAICPL